MSLWNFYEYKSPSGDKYQFQITDKNVMYLIHKNNKGKIVNRINLNEGLDEHRIVKGFNNIDEIIANVPSLEHLVKSALVELSKKRKQMKRRK